MSNRKTQGNFDETWRPDFEQALGEEFGECVCPPVPFEDASPHECCEVVWAVVGREVTPARLAGLTQADIAALVRQFALWFDCEDPSVGQIKMALKRILARWPAGEDLRSR